MNPLTRSLAALPADYRKTLEASNLPIEVATAIADALDLALNAAPPPSRGLKPGEVSDSSLKPAVAAPCGPNSERYQWLRDSAKLVEIQTHTQLFRCRGGEELDKVIDTARDATQRSMSRPDLDHTDGGQAEWPEPRND